MNRANNTLRTISGQVCCEQCYLESCDPVAQLDRVLDSEANPSRCFKSISMVLILYPLGFCGFLFLATYHI
jgi:hypothetical protein